MAKAKSHSVRDEPGAHELSTAQDEEDVGLLTAGQDADDIDEEDLGLGDHHDLHPSTTHEGAAQRLPPSAIITSGDDFNGTPRTPRTPNRVRFDLRPTIVNGAANGDAYHHSYDEDLSLIHI